MFPLRSRHVTAELIRCAGAVIRDSAGRLLLVQRGREPGRGKWSLPGGRIEPGETAAEAAAREVFEETGLTVEIGAHLAAVEIGRYVVDDFAATVVGGTLAAADDADDVRWCLPEELAELPLTTGLIDELRRMRAL